MQCAIMSEDCMPVLYGSFVSEADLVDLSIYLPRNLSYAEESYISRYGLTNNFVHSPKQERGFRFFSELYRKKHVEAGDHAFCHEAMSSHNSLDSESDSPGCFFPPGYRYERERSEVQPEITRKQENTDDEGCDVDSCELCIDRDRTQSVESASSLSEEGIFENDMESIDSNGKLFENDSCVFSKETINSTEEENNLRKSNEGCEASIGVRVSSAIQSIMIRDNVNNVDQNSDCENSTVKNVNFTADGNSGDVESVSNCATNGGDNDDENQSDIIFPPAPCNWGKTDTEKESEHSNETSFTGKKSETQEEQNSQTSSGRKSPPRLNFSVCDQFSFDQSSQGGSQRSILDLFENSSSPLYEEEEFNFSKGQLRKSSSLKTNKTPPGTPRRKKMVRFADALGLDLESVRHVLNADAPPKIPASAMKDLQVGIEDDRKSVGNRFLSAVFPQPGASENFLQKVIGQKLSLENAVVTNLTITGVVRVANIGFHKSVRVRYTTNGWVTFHDIMASYVQNSCDGPTDRFSFSLVAPAEFSLNSRLECALSYTVNDTTYWDNNDGKNYVFECYAKTTPTDPQDSWIHFV